MAGLAVSALAFPALASDHLFTAQGAGGLKPSSQPFQNGVNNPGRPATSVPGQGSPLSGADHTTPAVETGSLLTHHFSQPNTNANPGTGSFKTPPPVSAGKVAPSVNSPHTAIFH
jgi:hypothetical protein